MGRLLSALHSGDDLSLNCQTAEIDRHARDDFAVFVEMNVVVQVCDDADMIRNDANAFSEFRFSCGARQIEYAMFFAESGNDRVRIFWKEAVSASWVGRQEIAGKCFAAGIDYCAVAGGTAHDCRKNCQCAFFLGGCAGDHRRPVVVDISPCAHFGHNWCQFVREKGRLCPAARNCREVNSRIAE